MSRRHSGKFSAKHPPDVKIEANILREVTAGSIDGRISCQSAHAIATSLKVPPAQIGVAIDMQNARIHACQLGLFGYGRVKTISATDAPIAPELSAAVRKGLIDGRLSCARAWQIAALEGVSRTAIGRACEMMGIKINRCQLGAFE